ncbi:unnamed protein product [Lactuca virosa]|uniref:F-box/LRR-repeat protein 15/At3g58940/PEG3-like LRR domain-containing protein n=1 Tax=Lactuca virosa TaxID=75947 RepID=A0AAU9M3X2_9ASTR|nr:unnamed protein product [Lactuca virosa]
MEVFFGNAILHVLLLHKGPILEIVVCMADTYIFNEFNQIILHLSRSNNLKIFIFEIWSPNSRYKLPSLFFSLHGLEHLDLTDCVFEPPLLFNGFSMLRKLRFHNVDITIKTLLRFLTDCPLLEEFTMNLVDLKDYSGLNLAHLKEFEMTSFHNYAPEMEFLKLITTKSSLLKEAQIELNTSGSDEEKVQMFQDLLQMPFLHASLPTEFIIERI